MFIEWFRPRHFAGTEAFFKQILILISALRSVIMHPATSSQTVLFAVEYRQGMSVVAAPFPR
jgi:hypothetical protein